MAQARLVTDASRFTAAQVDDRHSGRTHLAGSLTAAMLRYQAGRDPFDADLTVLIGELSTRSIQFRTHWADRDVHEHRTGTKTYRHPDIGALELTSSNCQATPACSSPLLRPERNTDRRQPLTAHQLDRKTDP